PALVLDDRDEPPDAGVHNDPAAPASGPVRIYRQPAPAPSGRRIAVRVVALTTLLGLVIGAVALTAAELIAGQSIGRSDSATSLVGGKSRKTRSSPDTETRSPAPAETTTVTAPTTPEEQPTVTVTVPTETTPAPTTATTPTQTAP
ncbi:MAG: hypothetical protein JW895_03345, partial [Thermoleophilaceae bacterium]|nr:hypothetical protein [Thermoleophilaceae bacterium]